MSESAPLPSQAVSQHVTGDIESQPHAPIPAPTQQVMAGVLRPGYYYNMSVDSQIRQGKKWSDGLFDCFSDMYSCCLACIPCGDVILWWDATEWLNFETPFGLRDTSLIIAMIIVWILAGFLFYAPIVALTFILARKVAQFYAINEDDRSGYCHIFFVTAKRL
jgi:hypothetical protein